MDLIRTLVSSKIKEGTLSDFISSTPDFANVVYSTESETLQFECFANKDLSQVVWLETFTGTKGADFHLGNPALQASQMKIMPLVEQLIDVIYQGNVSSNILDKLKMYGMDPILLQHPEGTEMAKSERSEENIQVYSHLEVNDMSSFQSLFKEIKSASDEHEGHLFHQLYVKDDTSALAISEVKNESAQLAWSEKFSSTFGDQFQSLVTNVQMTACVASQPSDELIDLAKHWNTTIFQKVAGFTRY